MRAAARPSRSVSHLADTVAPRTSCHTELREATKEYGLSKVLGTARFVNTNEFVALRLVRLLGLLVRRGGGLADGDAAQLVRWLWRYYLGLSNKMSAGLQTGGNAALHSSMLFSPAGGPGHSLHPIHPNH